MMHYFSCFLILGNGLEGFYAAVLRKYTGSYRCWTNNKCFLFTSLRLRQLLKILQWWQITVPTNNYTCNCIGFAAAVDAKFPQQKKKKSGSGFFGPDIKINP